MLQLAYISTARPELPMSAVDDILQASRRNNDVAGITGILLYDGYRFLQALEGDASLVRMTYDRIKADLRHRALVMLSCCDVVERSFGDRAITGQRVAIVSGTTVPELIDRLTDGVADPIMRDRFRSFARLRRAA